MKALRIFEECMRIAELRVVERRPEEYMGTPNNGWSYIVEDRKDSRVGASCLIRDGDAEWQGWSAAAYVVEECANQREWRANPSDLQSV